VAAFATPQHTLSNRAIRNRETSLPVFKFLRLLLLVQTKKKRKRSNCPSLLRDLREPYKRLSDCTAAFALTTKCQKREEKIPRRRHFVHRTALPRPKEQRRMDCAAHRSYGQGQGHGRCTAVQLIAARRRQGNRSWVESARAV